MTFYDDKSSIAFRMERLREMVDEGEISPRAFKREYGALSRQLLGDREYEHAQRQRKRKLRGRVRQRDSVDSAESTILEA